MVYTHQFIFSLSDNAIHKMDIAKIPFCLYTEFLKLLFLHSPDKSKQNNAYYCH